MSIRLGYQIPNFSYPGGDTAAIFPTVVAQAREAEAGGFDTVLLMDHFYQLPGIGAPEEPMMEAYTTLGALAASTKSIQLSTLVTGNTYRNPAMLAKTASTLNNPRVRDSLPIMLGGSGEKKTFGLAARFADHLNIICDASELPRKLDAVKQRCAEVDRDPATLETSFLAFGMIADTHEQADALVRDHLRSSGADPDTMDDDAFAAATDRIFYGTGEEVAEKLQHRVLDTGVDGIIINLVRTGHLPGAVEQAGAALAPLVR